MAEGNVQNAVKVLRIPSDRLSDVASDSSCVVLDAREWPDFCRGHLPGSLFVTLDPQFAEIVNAYVKPSTGIYLVVSEDAAPSVAEMCASLGRDQVLGWIDPSQVAEHCESCNVVGRVEEIDMAELPSRLGSSKALPLDVRLPDELRQTGRIVGACHIAHLQLAVRADELPNGKTIYVYCRSGNRSRFAASFLQREGHSVVHVAGGILACQQIASHLVRVEP